MKDEFVMVPRDWAESIISAGPGEPVCRTDLDTLRAAIAEQHQGEPVTLPARKPEIDQFFGGTDAEWYSNQGWNACLDEIAKLGSLYTRPAQGEPVAWRGINELGEVVTEWIDGAPPSGMVDLCGKPASFARIELAFTHADPAEIERLQVELTEAKADASRARLRHRQLCAKHAEILAERDTLRAEIAERDALLRQCGNPVRAQISRLEDEAKRSDHPKLYRDEVERLSVILRQMDALSAGAEPSAPIYPKCTVLKGVPVRYSTSTAPVEIWGTPKQIFSAHEFVASYCQKSGISEDDFYESEVPMPSTDSPHGWAAVSNHPLSIKAHVKIHLSGKAEAIEIDEQAVFESYILSRGVELPIGAELIDGLYCQGYPEMEDPADDQAFEALNSHWAAWQARAALERKP